jgi:chromosomal replication initiator protein
VLELIAERVTGNIRTLEGALIRVVAYHSLTRRPIDVELASKVLNTMYPTGSGRSLSVNAVQRTVADYYGITVAELVSTSRVARLAWPRQVAMHLARELTGAPLNAIGSAFGGRNHTTIHYACARVSDRMLDDQTVAHTLDELTQSIRAHVADRGS